MAANLLVGPNVWQTPARIHMVPAKPNNLVHIFDYNSTGSYTITYGLPVVAPSVTTLNALDITPTNATLEALVNPNGGVTQIQFQWGATTNYGYLTQSTTLSQSLNSPQSVPLPIGGLLPVSTNHYRAVAVNSAGTTYGADLTVVTPSLPPPVITQVPSQLAVDGQDLIFTNTVQASTLPVTFSLASSAPAGATITTNGIFSWTPACAQGSTTNMITIWATDSSSPPLSNSMTFVVSVSECVEVGLGRTVMQVGQTNGVPVTLLSTVDLTNLNWTVVSPSNRLGYFTFVFTNDSIATSTVQVLDSSRSAYTLTTKSNQTLQSPSQLGTMMFTALPGHSAFLPLVPQNILAKKTDGSLAGNVAGEPGRVVVIGPEPLLEAWIGSNSVRMLALYGNPGTNYQVLTNTSLSSTSWQAGWSVTLSNLFEDFPADPLAPRIFYRAR